MPSHPFGCDFPSEEENHFGYHWAFVTGEVDVSTQAMIAYLRSALARDCSTNTIQRLRIFNVQHTPADPNQHLCYFEVWTTLGVFLCGDCNNFTRAGLIGGEHMRDVFTCLSNHFKVEVEV